MQTVMEYSWLIFKISNLLPVGQNVLSKTDIYMFFLSSYLLLIMV